MNHSFPRLPHTASALKNRGYTLVELIIATGLFALVMLLASGAYLMMIGINRQAQGVSAGIDNLSFALEVMTRSIRTGSDYDCGGSGDCPSGATTFSFTSANGEDISYSLSGNALHQTIDGSDRTLTDSSVTISSLTFYADGTGKPAGDYEQAHVSIIISGTVSYGAGESQDFTIETGATMRGTDL